MIWHLFGKKKLSENYSLQRRFCLASDSHEEGKIVLRVTSIYFVFWMLLSRQVDHYKLVWTSIEKVCLCVLIFLVFNVLF